MLDGEPYAEIPVVALESVALAEFWSWWDSQQTIYSNNEANMDANVIYLNREFMPLGEARIPGARTTDYPFGDGVY